MTRTVATDAKVPADQIATRFESSLDAADRKLRGAVHTPMATAEFILVESAAQWISNRGDLDIQECRNGLTGVQMTAVVAEAILDLVPHLRVLDPAVGAGIFLRVASIVLSKAVSRASARLQVAEPIFANPVALLNSCCRGFDLDFRAVEVANEILGGDSDHLVQPIQHVQLRDALTQGMSDPVLAPNGWDIIVMNPPYIGAKFTRARLGGSLSERLEARHGFAGDLLAHFMAEAVTHLASGGVLGAIVSDTFFTAEGAQKARNFLLSTATLATTAWCRPFKNVAVRAGIAVLVRGEPGDQVWWAHSTNGDLSVSGLSQAPREAFDVLPGRPLFVPDRSAARAVKLWRRVGLLTDAWSLANSRSAVAKRRRLATLDVGDWTLIGIATQGGQGLATGDDREFVGYVDGTRSARTAHARVVCLLHDIRCGAAGDRLRLRLTTLERRGITGESALSDLNRHCAGHPEDRLPGRKPFKVIPRSSLRLTPLSDEERKSGIVDNSAWVPYEMGDSSGIARSGAEWIRELETVINWSRAAVSTLRSRVADGPRRPFWRNETMWFCEGVTHNRVTSFLRARLLPKTSMFSSESPAYVPIADWLDTNALLALLNSEVVRYLVHTFLATRNHVEVGHVRRVPVPVLEQAYSSQLSALGALAVTTAQNHGDTTAIRRDINELVADAYRWAPPTRSDS
jgi:hypothetical protein